MRITKYHVVEWLATGASVLVQGLAVAVLFVAAVIAVLNLTVLRGLVTPLDLRLALHLAIAGAIGIGLGIVLRLWRRHRT
jgi:hypothetical protein